MFKKNVYVLVLEFVSHTGEFVCLTVFPLTDRGSEHAVQGVQISNVESGFRDLVGKQMWVNANITEDRLTLLRTISNLEHREKL